MHPMTHPVEPHFVHLSWAVRRLTPKQAHYIRLFYGEETLHQLQELERREGDSRGGVGRRNASPYGAGIRQVIRRRSERQRAGHHALVHQQAGDAWRRPYPPGGRFRGLRRITGPAVLALERLRPHLVVPPFGAEQAHEEHTECPTDDPGGVSLPWTAGRSSPRSQCSTSSRSLSDSISTSSTRL